MSARRCDAAHEPPLGAAEIVAAHLAGVAAAAALVVGLAEFLLPLARWLAAG